MPQRDTHQHKSLKVQTFREMAGLQEGITCNVKQETKIDH